MALATATISYNLADLTGVVYDSRRTRVWASTNVEGDAMVDTVADKIRLGCGYGTIAADGTGSITVWTPGTGSNPASWQTTIHVDYPDRHGRATRSFGPFTITASADLADLVAEMPVQPEYAMQYLDLIQGYEDHGSVSGAVTIDPAKGTHVLDATSATDLTIDDAPNGSTVTVRVESGVADVTWVDCSFDTGQPTDDPATVTFLRTRDAWVAPGGSSGGTGGGTVTATAPTANDSTNTYTIPSKAGVIYKVGGVVKTAGTYSVGNVNTSVTVTAEADTGYTLTGTASWTFTFTYAVAWSTLAEDTFAGTNGTQLEGRTLDVTTSLAWDRTDTSGGTTTIDTNRMKFVSSGGNQLFRAIVTPAPTTPAAPAAARATLNRGAAADYYIAFNYTSVTYASAMVIVYNNNNGNLSVTATGADGGIAALTAVSGQSLTGNATTGEWQVEVTGSGVKVYIAGVLIATGSFPGTLLAQACRFDVETSGTAYIDSYKMEVGT